MKEKKYRTFILGASMITTICCFFVFGLLIGNNIVEPVAEKQVIDKTYLDADRKDFLVTGDADPGDNSGFFYFMIYPHQASPAVAYASNLSNATAYEFSDSYNTSCTGQTPYSTTFDIVIKVGVTDEDGSNSSGWQENFTWMHLTCADLGIAANTNISQRLIGSGPNYAYYQYFINNGGAGYTITENQDFNVTSAKHYVRRLV